MICLAASAAAIGLAGSAIAAPITWGTPATSSADTDVVTTGTLVNAINAGDGTTSPTVNGVTFTGVAGSTVGGASISSGNFTLATNSGFAIHGESTFGAASGDFVNLSTSYQNLLKSGFWNSAAGLVYTITFSNLTVGDQYAVQFWANNSQQSTGGRNVTLTDPNSHAVTLYENNSAAGNVGQFVTVTFTADATSEAIAMTGADGNNQLTAVQLRNVSVVPEPASLSLLGMAGLMLLNRRK
jgi:hypothetical protein